MHQLILLLRPKFLGELIKIVATNEILLRFASVLALSIYSIYKLDNQEYSIILNRGDRAYCQKALQLPSELV